MNTQKIILAQFKKIYGDLSYKEVAKLTGIQQTRTFRLFNGYSMKLEEYIIFKNLIDEKRGEGKSLEQLAHKCEERFSGQKFLDIYHYLERELMLWNIQQG